MGALLIFIILIAGLNGVSVGKPPEETTSLKPISCLDESQFDEENKMVCGETEFWRVEKDTTFFPGSGPWPDPRVKRDSSCDIPNVWTGVGRCALTGYEGGFTIRFVLKDKDAPHPTSDSIIDIYAKPTDIPDFVACKNSLDFTSKSESFTAAFLTGNQEYEALALPNPPPHFITFQDNNWQFLRNIDLREGELNDDREKIGSLTLAGINLNVWRYLVVGYDKEKTKDIIFLVEPDKLTSFGSPQLPFPFLEYRKLSTDEKENPRTLHLESFKPPIGPGWWHCFVVLGKPVIYLYPEEKTTLSIKLHPHGFIAESDPLYIEPNGWRNLTVYPNGQIFTESGGKYDYLFYETNLFDYSTPKKGFVIKKENLSSFFDKALPKLGLNESEKKDFKEYWLEKLDENGNRYFFITFLPLEEIERIDRVEYSQLPDTEIRIIAYFHPLNSPKTVEPLALPSHPPERHGFTIVEWGGILD